MEILQQNDEYRILLKRIGNKNHLTLHERKTGLTQTITHDPVNMPSNTMESLRKSYATIPIDKLKKAFDSWNVAKVKIYKAGV